MRARDARTEWFELDRRDPYPGLYRPHRPPPPSARERAEIWRARRERAWTAAGWLTSTLLLLIISYAALHMFPAAFGIG